MKKSLFALCTVALALVACHKHVTPVLPTDGTIRFTTNIQPYTLKSTATSLDENDAVGIFATAPVSGENVKYTVGADGLLTAADPLKWVPEDETPITFMAYYPYGEEVTSTVVPFAVQADQTSGTASSDLMAATAKNVTPGSEVTLAFTHQLSKVIVKVTNNLTDVSVASVTIEDVVLTADLDLSAGSLTAGTATSSVKAASVGEGQFEAIIVPQTAKPSIVVKTSGADVYTFVLPSSAEFVAGATATAELTLNPQVTPEPQVAALSFSVADWGENTDLVFDDPVVGQKAWSVIGTVNGSAWDTDFPMTELSAAYTWTIDITYAEGDEFKFRYDGSWDIQYGSWEGSETIESETYGLNPDAGTNKNILLPEAGEYTLTLVTGGENAGQLTVVKK